MILQPDKVSLKRLPSPTAECVSLQFIDLCILLGCDYCGTIKGIGPKRAIDLIKQHGSIEEILENIDPNVRLLKLKKKKKSLLAPLLGPSTPSFVLFFLGRCRSTRRQTTGCTRRPGSFFSSPKWWIAPRWSSSGTSRTRAGCYGSCVKKNSSGKTRARG